VNLARALGIEVTAEGVETDAQRTALKLIGVDELQGFLMSPSVSVKEINRLFDVDEEPAAASAA
jgi:EAL domain-containing protein (putative c-di-GMP-specific phosphodiesterase class I)